MFESIDPRSYLNKSIEATRLDGKEFKGFVYDIVQGEDKNPGDSDYEMDSLLIEYDGKRYELILDDIRDIEIVN